MKRITIILLAFAALVSSCSDKDVWSDHEDPTIYIPRNGVSFNTAWMLDTDEYVLDIGVYLSGVRPSNQETNIEVSFSVDESIITDYNNDITQEFAGQVIMLPSNCYEITSTTVTIPSGEISAMIPVKIFTDQVDALGMAPDDIYAIPIRLEETSVYRLSDNESMLDAIYGVTVDQPVFYFWVNRDETTSPREISRRVIYGSDVITENFRITSYGLGLGESFDLTVEVDPTMLPAGGTLLPADAYELETSTVTIDENSLDVYFPVRLINENIPFREIFYLPLTITEAAPYMGDPVKGTLLLKVEVKNDYEWSYVSKASTFAAATQRSIAFQMTKSPVTWDESTLLMNTGTITDFSGENLTLGTGAYILPAYFSPSYWGTYKLKIIPTDDVNKWDVEYINAASTTAPASFEADPNNESYYDWDNETFHLYYRYLHTGGGVTDYIYVFEILEAQF